jgi:LPS sulfotransferase NodH
MWDHVDEVRKQFAKVLELGDATPSEVFAAAFPNLRYIWLTRRDKLRQGISYYRAMETKVWRSTDIPKVAHIDPPFNFEAIQNLVELCTWEDEGWQTYFRQNAIEPCTVVYEDLLDSPTAAVRRILSYMAIQPHGPLFREGAWQHQRQSDTTSEEWVKRYEPRAHTRQ